MGLRLRRPVALVGLVATVAVLFSRESPAYHVNGRHWDTMPIPYYINPEGAPVLSDGTTPEQYVADAAAAWSAAPCADVRFQAMGSTTVTWAADGQNTVFFVTDDWQFGVSAAGSTLWIPTAEGVPMEVDLALNAADFRWVAGGGNATQVDVVAPRAVIAHEFGHWLGLAHSDDVFATMYQALLPSGIQATLAGDDLAGICTLYPNGEPGCTSDADCDDDHACVEVAAVPVCEERHDPIGAPCDKDHLDCEGMCFISFYECGAVCVFTKWDYSEGYCAPLCGDGDACPEGWTCADIPGEDVARVCRLDPVVSEPVPETAEEAVPGPDWSDEAGPAPDDAISSERVAEEAMPDAVSDPGAADPGAAVDDVPEPGETLPDGPAGRDAAGCQAVPGPATPAAPSWLFLWMALAWLGARSGTRGSRGRRERCTPHDRGTTTERR